MTTRGRSLQKMMASSSKTLRFYLINTNVTVYVIIRPQFTNIKVIT